MDEAKSVNGVDLDNDGERALRALWEDLCTTTRLLRHPHTPAQRAGQISPPHAFISSRHSKVARTPPADLVLALEHTRRLSLPRLSLSAAARLPPSPLPTHVEPAAERDSSAVHREGVRRSQLEQAKELVEL